MSVSLLEEANAAENRKRLLNSSFGSGYVDREGERMNPFMFPMSGLSVIVVTYVDRGTTVYLTDRANALYGWECVQLPNAVTHKSLLKALMKKDQTAKLRFCDNQPVLFIGDYEKKKFTRVSHRVTFRQLAAVDALALSINVATLEQVITAQREREASDTSALLAALRGLK